MTSGAQASGRGPHSGQSGYSPGPSGYLAGRLRARYGLLRARYGRTAIIVAAVVAVAVVIVAIAVAAGGAARAAGGPSDTVSETAGSIRTVDFQGVPGQLIVTPTPGDQVRLTGQLAWRNHHRAGTASARVNDGVLYLVSRCAAGSPCTENYRLAVPAHTAVTLTQPSGHVVVSGLDAALRITAEGTSISATGLRSPSLTATLRSAHLGATFVGAPQRVSVTLTSAQATIQLPAAVPYRVSQQVSSGYIRVGVPQAPGASRSITARISSGELELLS